jgi:hypothetical protein
MGHWSCMSLSEGKGMFSSAIDRSSRNMQSCPRPTTRLELAGYHRSDSDSAYRTLSLTSSNSGPLSAATIRLLHDHYRMGLISKAFKTTVVGGAAATTAFAFWTRNCQFVPFPTSDPPQLPRSQEIQPKQQPRCERLVHTKGATFEH